MLLGLFLQGSLIGFSMAIPVGPVAMVCIHNSLKRGLMAGLAAGFGAALADALYGGMACFGVSLLSQVLQNYQIWFQVVGALILCILGIRIFKTEPSIAQSCRSQFNLGKIFLSTFALTLTNPLTFLCFAAIYTSFGIAPPGQEILPAASLTLGVLLGAAIWWITMSSGVFLIGRKYQLNSSPFLYRVSGGVLTGCGCIASLSVLKQGLFLLGIL